MVSMEEQCHSNGRRGPRRVYPIVAGPYWRNDCRNIHQIAGALDRPNKYMYLCRGYLPMITLPLIFFVSILLQICGLLWSQEYQELASSHGAVTPENNDIVLWKMSRFQFEPQTRLQQHLARPLHMALSPDETTIGSIVISNLSFCAKCYHSLINASLWGSDISLYIFFVASAGVDEMMCIWDCFPENQENLRRPSFSSLALDHMIR